jgi:hypothetical protein
VGVLQKGNISQKTQEKCRPPIVMQLQFIHEVILQRTKQVARKESANIFLSNFEVKLKTR